jgi:hypothetical protein
VPKGSAEGGVMTVARLIAIAFIYGGTTLAWFTLGGTIVSRTGESDGHLRHEVEQLWGGTHVQVAPEALVERPRVVTKTVAKAQGSEKVTTETETKTVVERTPVPLSGGQVRVGLALDHRKKGLLWYDTYEIGFEGRYTFSNPDELTRRMVVRFTFPAKEAIYDDFRFVVNGIEAPAARDLNDGLSVDLDLAPHAAAEIEIAYRSRGLGSWAYAFTKDGIAQVKDFTLEMTTDFEKIDFPAGTLSPSRKVREGEGWRLFWEFSSLTAGQRIGIDTPNRLNPGPIAARITFFAPVGLLFFMTVMTILGIIQGRSLHPMNYVFLAAAFFAFHLLMAYLVDHVDIHVAFVASAATSIFLVVSYLRLVAGTRVALIEAGAAQLVFLVLFSYAFFFEGYTGLAVTIGAILTLFVLMQMTARIDWAEVFKQRASLLDRSEAS